MNTQDAIATINDPFIGVAKHMEACLHLATHSEELDHPVYFLLDQGVRYFPDRLVIRRKTEGVCSCGRVRGVYPLNYRTEFAAHPSQAFTLTSNDLPVYFRRSGAPKRSAVFGMLVKNGRLMVIENPFEVVNVDKIGGAIVVRVEIAHFSVPLEVLAEKIKEGQSTILTKKNEKGVELPVYRVDNVDLTAQSVTVVPDSSMDASQTPYFWPEH